MAEPDGDEGEALEQTGRQEGQGEGDETAGEMREGRDMGRVTGREVRGRDGAEGTEGTDSGRAGRPAPPEEVLLTALAQDLAPVRQRLESILQIEDPGVMEARLRAFLADLDDIKADLQRDPESAQALHDIMSAALAKGLTEGKGRVLKHE
jgi:hypothetical protein